MASRVLRRHRTIPVGTWSYTSRCRPLRRWQPALTRKCHPPSPWASYTIWPHPDATVPRPDARCLFVTLKPSIRTLQTSKGYKSGSVAIGTRKNLLSYQLRGGFNVSSRFEDEIRWDGNSLTVWATLNGSRIFCEIPRSTIHEVPLFGDAISREIDRDRAEIFDRLRPAVVAKISRTRESSIRLHPSDIS
jgi:hypothetical protein